MLITNPVDYKVGDFVLFDGAGPAFTVLSWLLGRWDKAWRVLKRKPWHTGFLIGKDPEGYWKVGEAKGGVGITGTRLTDFKEPYQVFRWFNNAPNEADVHAFLMKHMGDKYDAFWGYLFTILWFFISWFPRVIDRRVQCWEFLYQFAVMFGKPLDEEYAYPLITIIMVKLGFPGY
jgi:hypothetical protein